ncbi:c-type cytochrome [Flavobacterium chuncheonense]|uniref:C-type cytochrome n=1 Tax=Flavobacterium chuncheonense TaxID=2026653 RepID=A0ABW5YN95_9FLAO
MKSLYKIVTVVGLSFMATSCFNESKPNYQFFPNMYEAVPYETYSEHGVFANGKEGQLPAEGSIKRGFVPYEIPNTTEGYELAKASLVSPLAADQIDHERGKQLFDVYCAICHGEKGDGKGNLVKREKFLGVPSYKDREITAGSIYHVETYGLNSMGSHANQLTQEERWQVADYVLKLRSEL